MSEELPNVGPVPQLPPRYNQNTLYIDEHDNELYYVDPEGDLIDAVTMEHIRFPASSRNLTSIIDLSDSRRHESEPVYVETQNGRYVLQTGPRSNLLYSLYSGRALDANNADPSPITDVRQFRYPNPPLRLTGFDQEWFNRLVDTMNRGGSLYDSVTGTRLGPVNLPNPEIAFTNVRRRLNFDEEMPEPEENSSTDSLFEESYTALLKRLYGLPVTLPESIVVHGLSTPFVSFEEVVRSFQNGAVQRYDIDPLLQPWAGPATDPHRIITLFYTDGRSALARVLWNPVTNEIFPPLH